MSYPGFYGAGLPGAHGRSGELILCTSDDLVVELIKVVNRGKFARRLKLAGLVASNVIDDYVRIATTVQPVRLPRRASRDVEDDKVIACAAAAKARLIATGDRDLLDLGSASGIPIVTPAQALAFVERYGKKPTDTAPA